MQGQVDDVMIKLHMVEQKTEGFAVNAVSQNQISSSEYLHFLTELLKEMENVKEFELMLENEDTYRQFVSSTKLIKR